LPARCAIKPTHPIPGKIDDSALSLEHIFVPITPIMFKEGIGEINDAWPARQLMKSCDYLIG